MAVIGEQSERDTQACSIDICDKCTCTEQCHFYPLNFCMGLLSDSLIMHKKVEPNFEIRARTLYSRECEWILGKWPVTEEGLLNVHTLF